MVRTRAALALVLSLLLIPLFGCGDESATGTADQTVESTDPDAENDLIQAMIDRESIVFRTGSITLNDLFPTSGADSAAESAFLANVVEVTRGERSRTSSKTTPLTSSRCPSTTRRRIGEPSTSGSR